ncbi:hypothetical protein Q3A91_22435 [Nocardia mangyaensis]|nr:hypothetical protein [Nocardia mangyaensis]
MNDAALQTATRSLGPAAVGNHTAAARKEVIALTGSTLTTTTSCPRRSNSKAVVRPTIPDPTTTARTSTILPSWNEPLFDDTSVSAVDTQFGRTAGPSRPATKL